MPMRVFKLAKELGVTNVKIAEIAAEFDIKVSHPLQSLSDDKVQKIRNRFLDNVVDINNSTKKTTD
jgi:hypothetical protein